MSIAVAVVGAAGRMGSTVCQAVQDADGLELVARLDVGDTISAETLNGAEVAVDFTVPAVTEANVHALIDAGVDVVVGTTGWTDESYERVREHLARPEAAGRSVIIAPNFALSAVLTMSFAAKAARYFESAEVIELHHPNKVDAPSGTAIATARGIAASRAEAELGPVPDATETDPDGARGAVVDGVHIHAVRLRGLTAHEEVVLGNPGEQLTIRTDSFDRASFMPGVVLAVREVGGRGGLTIGLDQLLDL
ncbi:MULTISPECIES: 4-hydroxy-tetrahydrodipicolinate reductase [unclassified Actinomyces]|uniref:4-hydroxy-tetrahydrodipicolinate reductase n=1 Tax=unclassified Actinomyces TaxID=2609248 RepID=UPI000D591245|nr:MULTISPECIES: 4-hydroxy-tetrahydrodipicolinate reductase [unclassified Actinomyces]RAX23981.1 4-hydroxy-tetrahydrodipicolinate reductase [Actinomyces sp. Z3]